MPLAALLPMLGSLISQGVEMFAGDNHKLARIADIASGALNRAPGMIEAVSAIFGGDPTKKLTPENFDTLVASIRAEDDEAHRHHQEALARDGTV